MNYKMRLILIYQYTFCIIYLVFCLFFSTKLSASVQLNNSYLLCISIIKLKIYFYLYINVPYGTVRYVPHDTVMDLMDCIYYD